MKTSNYSRNVLLLLSVVALSGIYGCGTTYSGNSQNVTIVIPTKNVTLTIDSVRVPVDSSYAGVGTAFKPTLISDGDFKQLTFKADGHKTKYYTIYSEGDFQETYGYDPLPKFKYCDSTTKKLFVSDVNIDKNVSGKTYWYKEYLQKAPPLLTSKIDNFEINSEPIENNLNNLLKQLNFIDTVNTVFVDNVNTMKLDAAITKTTLFTVSVFSMFHPTYFTEAEVSITWTAKSIYGDTIRQDSFTLVSGRFSIPQSKNNTVNINRTTFYQTIYMDVIEMSLYQFMDSLSKQGLLKTEPTTIDFKDKITISKPHSSPSNVDEGMKATVTIKDNEGHGSGFLISNDGYIITNHHVVSKSTPYTVLTNDGKSYTAKVVRTNKAADIALLKVDGKFDHAFALPETQNFKVGDEVLAIGTPKSIQLGQSAAKGIVSGTREYKGSKYLQTDISVNRGNSGGPIILAGNSSIAGVVEFKLIGRGTEGVSFSIPAYQISKLLNISY